MKGRKKWRNRGRDRQKNRERVDLSFGTKQRPRREVAWYKPLPASCEVLVNTFSLFRLCCPI